MELYNVKIQNILSKSKLNLKSFLKTIFWATNQNNLIFFYFHKILTYRALRTKNSTVCSVHFLKGSVREK